MRISRQPEGYYVRRGDAPHRAGIGETTDVSGIENTAMPAPLPGMPDVHTLAHGLATVLADEQGIGRVVLVEHRAQQLYEFVSERDRNVSVSMRPHIPTPLRVLRNRPQRIWVWSPGGPGLRGECVSRRHPTVAAIRREIIRRIPGERHQCALAHFGRHGGPKALPATSRQISLWHGFLCSSAGSATGPG